MPDSLPGERAAEQQDNKGLSRWEHVLNKLGPPGAAAAATEASLAHVLRVKTPDPPQAE